MTINFPHYRLKTSTRLQQVLLTVVEKQEAKNIEQS